MHHVIIRNRCSKANQTILVVNMAFVIAHSEETDDMTCCKFENFRENFIFANSVKTHICDFENRDKGVIHLYISINDRVI